jgi:hypothetical protein
MASTQSTLKKTRQNEDKDTCRNERNFINKLGVTINKCGKNRSHQSYLLCTMKLVTRLAMPGSNYSSIKSKRSNMSAASSTCSSASNASQCPTGKL